MISNGKAESQIMLFAADPQIIVSRQEADDLRVILSRKQ
jgi:hypothetical protein